MAERDYADELTEVVIQHLVNRGAVPPTRDLMSKGTSLFLSTVIRSHTSPPSDPTTAPAWLEEAVQGVVDELLQASHYAHHDPKGTAGANCPACHAMRRARVRLDELLAIARKHYGGTSG